MKETVNCDEHGPKDAVIVCIHVCRGSAAQLFVVPAHADAEEQAWCGTCEAARVADDGWCDAADAVAKWELVCVSCYRAATEGIREVTRYDGVDTPDT